MDFRFASQELERVWIEANSSLGHGKPVDEKFRQRVSAIKNAKDERDLRALKSLHYERLKGKRKHQWSIRVNDQWRLIVEWEKTNKGKRIVLLNVEDYH